MSPRREILSRVLEIGLVLTLVLAPLPFGAVVPSGRFALELGALLLLVIWMTRARFHPTSLPPRLVLLGMIGLVTVALLQALPVPAPFADLAAPTAMEIRAAAQPPEHTLAVEAQLLDVEPAAFQTPATLSLDPWATASALRTGIALAALLLVATTVAAERGVRMLAAAALVSAGFQGLYGLLVLISGHDRIWHVPKKYGLDAATGTFVNRNHFACLLAMSLACGAALVIQNARASRSDSSRPWLTALLSPTGSRNLLLVLLLLVGAAGLLTSFSRAGIAVGVLALAATGLAARRSHRLRSRLVATALVICFAVLPLAQIGADRLIDRYAKTVESFEREGGRATVWLDTLRMASDFPLFGAGYGTFAHVYPLYRSPEVRLFYDHAHNDLLEAAVEGGSIGIVFLALLLIPVLGAIIAGIGGAKGTLGVGFAAGLAAILLHSFVDFNFHIPANAATAAILAGALLGLPWTD